MSVQNPKRVVTKQDLADFYAQILPYLGGSVDAGFTPVGTVISVMGVTAPANYLACNGQVVNIADYPELANYFYQQFGSKNKFGGDGTTTFAVPDLRGEFLRGTGTNSHTNQGNGSAVGTHQDATSQILHTIDISNKKYQVRTKQDWFMPYQNADKTTNTKDYSELFFSSASKLVSDTDITASYTSRPTNTSVLYCIATKNIYLNPSLDYSTDEKVVGTWIGGETIYQKTIIETFTTMSSDVATTKFIDLSSLNIEFLVSHQIIGKTNDTNGDESQLNTAWLSGNDMRFVQASYHGKNHTSVPRTLQITTNRASFSEATLYITIQYTKTS